LNPQPSILTSQQGPDDFWMMLQSGDRIGLEGLYKLYSHDLFRFGLSMVADDDFVQDCIQDVFIDLWKYHRTLQQANNVKVYLFKSHSRKISKASSKEKNGEKRRSKKTILRDTASNVLNPLSSTINKNRIDF